MTNFQCLTFLIHNEETVDKFEQTPVLNFMHTKDSLQELREAFFKQQCQYLNCLELLMDMKKYSFTNIPGMPDFGPKIRKLLKDAKD